MSSIAEVLACVAIEKVIWIDDLFNAAPDDPTVALREFFGTLHAEGKVPKHEKLEGLSLEQGVGAWVELAKKRLSFDETRELLKAHKSSTRESDYNENELAAVLSSAGKVEKVGSDRWSKEKEALKARIDHKTLVLIDRELGESIGSGDGVLAELTKVKARAVVMLTHSVSHADAEGLRAQIAKEQKLRKSQFAVLSKHRESEAVEKNLRLSIRTVMTQRACVEIAERVAALSMNEFEVAIDSMLSESIFDLDHVVFQNSLSEGALELEVLSRILALRQRVRLERELFTDAEVRQEIAQLRKLRGVEELAASSEEFSETLRAWRRDELFDPAERVNSANAPIRCGDIFKKDGGGKYFLLLAQPCDIALRPDGTRKSEQAFFVEVKKRGRDLNESSRNHVLPALLDADEWVVDFINWGVVNLRPLDLCAFRNDGSAKFARASTLPAGLLPGLEKRFNRVAEKVRNSPNVVPAELSRLTISERIPGGEVKASAQEIFLPFSRVGRLRSPWSIEAYASFSAYLTRTAFEHDFAQAPLPAGGSSPMPTAGGEPPSSPERASKASGDSAPSD